MDKWRLIFLLLFIPIVIFSAIYYNKPLKANNFTYNDFKNIYLGLINNFESENYTLISKKVESYNISVFPEGLLFDKRKALCFNDDSSKPSKFEIFYKDKNETTLIKLNIIFTPGNQNRGILFYQVISPDDNITIDDIHKKTPRPIMVETYESYGDFGVIVNAISIDNTNRYIEEKITETISNNWDFIKLLETYFSKSDFN